MADARQFGAVGDGQADDTAALQRMVEEGNGVLRLARGVYRITRPIVIELDRVGPFSVESDGTARLLMAGAGPALRFVGTHGGTAAPRTVQPEVWERQRMPLVDGLEIVGAHPEADGIAATGTMQLTITRVTVRDARHGIHLVERNRNVQISDCHLYNNRGVGVYLDKLNLHQINIVGCHISYNGGGGIVSRGSEIRNLQIGTCDIESNMAEDGPPTANILLDCREGTVREGAIVGCTIQHNHDAADSANIRFIGLGREQNQKVGNFLIGENAMSDVAVNIHLQNARGVAIANNTLWQGFHYNLLCEGCSHLVIGPNLSERNPDYRTEGDPADALLLRDCDDSTISGLHVSGVNDAPAGLVLEKCKRINLTGCTLRDSSGAALLVDGCQQTRVSDCIISAREEGQSLVVRGGSENMIVDNLLLGPAEIDEAAGMVEGNYSPGQ